MRKRHVVGNSLVFVGAVALLLLMMSQCQVRSAPVPDRLLAQPAGR